MERYFNTLKNEIIYQHNFYNDDELDSAIEEFAFVWYNHVRPHSNNYGSTLFEACFNSKNIRADCYNFA
ncbi:MAG: hypothetical protein A2Y17_12035 [Clostridiales bacterium GWF2_38_85]|nr:MAG: hypothetical protein A2Y17_12035 [Clostridiales bacterium GWF2_38_85]